MESEILAKVMRGDGIESVHRGHLIVVDGEGNTIFQLGNPNTITYWRSAAKAFQLIPFLVRGGAEHFNFTAVEIALACGSHSGEKAHTKIAKQMLSKIGLSEDDLQCGVQIPFDDETAKSMIKIGRKPTQLENNCSGKHAAMLAFAKFLEADTATYLSMDNPVQQKILETISIFTEIPKDEIKIGIDGCSAPNFAVPVSSMAKAYGKLTFPTKYFDEDICLTCLRVITAVMTFPKWLAVRKGLIQKLCKPRGAK